MNESARYKRTLLVFPPYEGGWYGALRPPLGIGYLAQVLEDRGMEYDVLDMSLGHGFNALAKRIRDFQPDLVGLSLMTLLYKRHYGLADSIKREFPHIALAAGGPHVSTLREQVLHDVPALDYGFVLEGERSLVQLVQGDPLAHIPGLIWRHDGTVRFNGEPEPILDLDTIEFPRFAKLERRRYVTDEIDILTSRGCPHKCIFCPVKAAIGRRFRARSAEHVADEIEHWHGQGVRGIGIADDNFTLDRDRVHAICDEIIRRGLNDMTFRCGNGIRADRVNRALLAKMWEAGFRFISFGVESGNDKVLEILKKGETIEQIRQAVSDACELGFEVTLFFIVGSPGETRQDVEDSIRLAKEFPVFDAKFYNLIPFPATELFDWVKERGLFLSDPAEYLNTASHWENTPAFETPELPRQARQEALAAANAARRQVRIQAMERKLRKFGPLAKIAARVFVIESMQATFLHTRWVRRPMQKLFSLLSGS